MHALVSRAKVSLQIPDTLVVAPKIPYFMLLTNWVKGHYRPELQALKVPADKVKSILRGW